MSLFYFFIYNFFIQCHFPSFYTFLCFILYCQHKFTILGQFLIEVPIFGGQKFLKYAKNHLIFKKLSKLTCKSDLTIFECLISSIFHEWQWSRSILQCIQVQLWLIQIIKFLSDPETPFSKIFELHCWVGNVTGVDYGTHEVLRKKT